MDDLKLAQDSLEQARAHLRDAVREARRQGRTWADIGDALGMTRQAAFKRFGETTNPASGRTKTGATVSLDEIRRLTEQVFDHISAGDYDSLVPLLHPDVQSELSEPRITETWARAPGEVGTKPSYGHTDEPVLGTVVGVTTLHCEAGEVIGRVAVDDERRVVGLLIVPVDHGPLPF